MEKMNGAKIVIETLLEQGVDTVFGYPGGRILQIYEQLYKYSDKITHYLVSHEQGAAHGADGYSRSTGKVGVCFATSGPGATNLVTGIATAYMDSIPMVAITANVSTNLIGTDAFQEVDITGITLPITKHNMIVRDVTKLADAIRTAFKIAKEGRKGPVLIDIPSDILLATCQYEKQAPLELIKADVPTNIQDAVSIINHAKKPVILLGGGSGAANCEDEIEILANKLNCPVVSTLMGLGVNHSDNFMGIVGMHGKRCANISLVKSDCIIAIGSRFNDRVAANPTSFGKNRKVIHIDIDKAEINKILDSYCHIVGDAKDALQMMIKDINKKDSKEFLEEIEAKKLDKPKILPQKIIEKMDELNPNGIVVTDVGQHQMWVAQYFKFKRFGQLLTSGGLGTMGYGIGAAIGAKVGNPEENVSLVIGDGCFGMNCNELTTIARYNIPIIIVLMNNGVLGMVRQWQTLFFDKHYSATNLENNNVNYEMLTKAYNINYEEVKNEIDFENAYKNALKINKPTLINCIIDKDLFVAPMVNSTQSADKFILE